MRSKRIGGEKVHSSAWFLVGVAGTQSDDKVMMFPLSADLSRWLRSSLLHVVDS